MNNSSRLLRTYYLDKVHRLKKKKKKNLATTLQSREDIFIPEMGDQRSKNTQVRQEIPV